MGVWVGGCGDCVLFLSCFCNCLTFFEFFLFSVTFVMSVRFALRGMLCRRGL